MSHATMNTSEALHRRVRQFIDESLQNKKKDVEAFDALACDVARFQATNVPAVIRLMKARAIDAASLRVASDIPAIPCDAFRLRRIAAHEAAQDERCFLTSGTTGGESARGRHAMRTTQTYTHAAIGWGKRMLWPHETDMNVVCLVASEKSAPESSLTFMLARFAEVLGHHASWHVVNGQLRAAEAILACQSNKPTLVCGTSFAFATLCKTLKKGVVQLCTQSRIMQTGGPKGVVQEISVLELRKQIASAFGVPEAHVISEYGMTELSSQLYQRPGGDAYHAPPWLHVTAVDPISLEALPAGSTGIARMVDLANVDSAIAIQTADLVSVNTDGSIMLHGRIADATARGCSLALEHLLAKKP